MRSLIATVLLNGLRDYGVEGQLGLEKSFAEYLDKLIEIYAEVKRVLKPSGTIWVNLGDSYGGSNQGYGAKENSKTGFQKAPINAGFYASSNDKPALAKQGLPKSLLNIPSRFAIKMTDELNLIQRNTIIWKKNNCIPSSATDRFTVDYEFVYFFTKNKKYYFEQILEPITDTAISRTKYVHHKKGSGAKVESGNYSLDKNFVYGDYSKGRNKRCVWEINTKPYKGSHFAVFPEALVRPMIQAGCPEFICTKCGKAREKIYEKGEFIQTGGSRKKDTPGLSDNQKDAAGYRPSVEIGYTDCGCNAPFTGGIVLDIFAGSGTTLKVAKEMGRNYIGIELNPEYIPLIEKRINSIPLRLAI